MIVKKPLFDRPLVQRDLRALLALVGSVVGSGVLTVFLFGLTMILWKGGWTVATEEQRLGALAWLSIGTLAIIGMVIMALGLAINKRTLKGAIGSASFEASGGEDAAPAATVTTTVTQSTSVPPPQPSE